MSRLGRNFCKFISLIRKKITDLIHISVKTEVFTYKTVIKFELCHVLIIKMPFKYSNTLPAWLYSKCTQGLEYVLVQ